MKKYSLLIMMGIALLLRLITISTRALWYDEAFAVLFSEKGLSAMLFGTLTPSGGVAADVHPLLYYFTLSGWMGIFGESPAVVRLYSVVLSLGTLYILYRLTCELFDQRTATVAALIAAVAPFYVQYSQEARMYALLGLLLMLATWCYLRGVRSGQPRYWMLFALFAGLSMYTQQLAAFYLLAIGLAALFSRQRALIARTALAGVGALIVYAPWLVNLPGQFGKLQSYWINKPTFAELLLTFRSFLFVDMDTPSALALIFALIATILLLIFLVYRGVAMLQRPNKDHDALALVLWLGFVPVILMWAVSQIRPVYLTRALLPCALMLYIALAWLFTRARLPKLIIWLLMIVGGVSAIAGLIAFYTWDTFPRPPFAAADQFLRTSVQPSDGVVHANKISMLPMVYYDRTLSQRYVRDVPGSGSDTLALPTQQSLGLIADACIAEAAHGAGQVWYVVFDRQGQNDLPWLDAHYHRTSVTTFNDLLLYQYDQPDSSAKAAQCEKP